MDFSYTPDQLALAEAVGKCLDRSAPEWPDPVWQNPSGLTEQLIPALGELGIFGSLVPEAQGGIGLTTIDIIPALVEMGGRIVPIPLIESILASTIIADAAPSHVGAVVSGAERASVAWNGHLTLSSGSNGRLSGELFDVGFGNMSRWIVATVRASDGRRGLVLLDMTNPAMRKRAKQGFDLSYPLCDISVGDLAISSTAVVWDKTADFRSIGVVLYCADLVGLAAACLERSKRHLQERKQFGRLLASNQVLRHRLADDLVALESSRLAVDYAGWALTGDPLGAPRAVSVAKSYVSRAAVDIAENALQIHGAMGFTWESPLHLMLRRILRCAASLGTPSEHHEQLAAEFLAENTQTHAIFA